MAKTKVKVKTGTLYKEPCEIGVLYLFEQSPLSPVAKVMDKALGRAISNLLKKGEFKPGLNKSYLLHTYGKVPAKRLLLLGLGKKKDLSFDKLRQATATAARETRDLGLKARAAASAVAASSSALVASATRACTSPVAGLNTSANLPEVPATSLPLIQ